MKNSLQQKINNKNDKGKSIAKNEFLSSLYRSGGSANYCIVSC